MEAVAGATDETGPSTETLLAEIRATEVLSVTRAEETGQSAIG